MSNIDPIVTVFTRFEVNLLAIPESGVTLRKRKTPENTDISGVGTIILLEEYDRIYPLLIAE